MTLPLLLLACSRPPGPVETTTTDRPATVAGVLASSSSSPHPSDAGPEPDPDAAWLRTVVRDVRALDGEVQRDAVATLRQAPVAFDACVQSRLLAPGTARGRLTVRIGLDQGRVEDVEVNGTDRTDADRAMLRCVEDEARQWRFPLGATGDVEQTLVLVTGTAAERPRSLRSQRTGGPGTRTGPLRVEIDRVVMDGDGHDEAAKAVRRYRGRIQACAEREAGEGLDLPAVLRLDLRIEHGRVQDVETRGGSASLHECSQRAARTWRLDTGVLGWLTVDYTLEHRR